MDYFNFKAEYQGLLSYTDKSSKILSNLKDLINNYYKLKDQALNSIKKSFDYLLVEVNKPINATYEIKNLFGAQKAIRDFINILNVSLANEINQNNKLQTDIIQQISDFIKFISNKNYLVLNDFKKLIDKVYYQKKDYEEAKTNYINCGKKLTILEEKISQKMNILDNNSINSTRTNTNSISTNTDEEEVELSESLRNQKKIFRKSENMYKEIIQDTNILYASKNEEYFKILKKFGENEESKENFFRCYLEKYSYFLKNNLKSSNTVIEYTESILEKISGVKKDENQYAKNNIFLINDKTRINQESFIDYEIYKAQLCNIANKNRMLLKVDNNNNNRFNISLEEIFSNEFKVSNNFFNQDEKLIIEQLFLMDDIDNFKFEEFCHKIKNNEKFAKNFIDIILERYTLSIGVQILNENNFEKLGKILNNILKNNSIQKNLFELNFAVAYISEKTFYQDDKNPFYKIYLCKLLMEYNPLIRTKQFWLKLLKLKIASSLENKADKESQKLFQEEKELEEKKLKEVTEKEKLSQSTYSINYRPSLFEFAGNMVSSFWYGKETEEKQKDEIRKHEIYNAIYYSKSKEICLKVINEFSTHFACFCLNSLDIVDILNEVTNEYNIKGEEKTIKFLIAKINSNMYSIKNSKFSKGNKYIDNKTDNETKYLNKFLNKNYLHGKLGKNNKSYILLNAMKYLLFSDYINILRVNKSTYKLISKILYKNLLINVDEIIPEEIYNKNKIPNVWKTPKLRIVIWKLLLRYKKENYDQILKNLDENKIQYLNIIKLDTKRMIFVGSKDPEIIKQSLNNILSCLSICNPKINYSQGMNFIAYLLYEICGGEEEAFQIFNCILKSTEYGNLFFEDLSRLNKYFYVFDRLIFIYLPEISLHFKNKDLTVRYFVSPWFITLFTNAFKHIKNQNNPKVLIWILDLFIINGWKSIIKIGLCLIKHFEIKILSCDLEELLHFLINDILKYDFFQNENYDNLRNIYEKLKIENGLIENIEREYELK